MDLTTIANFTVAIATLIGVIVTLTSNSRKHKKLTASLLQKQQEDHEKETALNHKFDTITQQVGQCQVQHNQESATKFNKIERELELEKEQNKATNDKLADAVINLKKEMNLKLEGMSQSMEDLKSSILSILEYLGHPPVVVPSSAKPKTKTKSSRK